MRSFKDLKVWQAARKLVVAIYRGTEVFPKSEIFGLTNQMRRASVSIASNIAEGCGRRTRADLVRFLDIAMGSAAEVECQILLASDLAYFDATTTEALSAQIGEVKAMLTRYTQVILEDDAG